MSACPVCGKSNEERAQRCGQCGAALNVLPFTTATPATRRMGHTMLGVPPLIGGALDSDTPDNAEPSPGEFQPFAPVPATLAGLAAEGPAEGAYPPLPTEPDPPQANGAAPARPGTLRGFAAVPTETLSEPANAEPEMLRNAAEPRPGGSVGTTKHATLMGVSPFGAAALPAEPNVNTASTSTPRPEFSSAEHRLDVAPVAPAAAGHETLLGVSPLIQKHAPPGTPEGTTKAAPGGATLMMGAISPLHAQKETPLRSMASQAAVASPTKAAPGGATLMMGAISPLHAQKETPLRSMASQPAVASPTNATMLGMAPLPDRSRPPAVATDTGNVNATLDVADAALAARGLPQASAQLPKAGEPHKTVLGVAPDALHLLGVAPPQIPEDPPNQDLNQEPRGAVHKGTLLGVAMPGIAPLQPGQAKPSPLPPEPPLPQAFLNAPPIPAEATRTTARSRIAWILAALALMLVLVVSVGLYMWWTAVHLTVQVSSTETGTEQLVLTCANCPDGTVVNLETKTARFKGQRTAIELAKRLVVGTNKLTLRVSRPNRARAEVVHVTVPIEFRVTSSIAELAGDPPSVTVQLDAPVGTKFTIQGRTQSVGSSGKLTVPIDVSSALLGPAPSVVPFEQRLSYEVVREGATTKGTLVVRTGITALEVSTPGPVHITQNPTFTLSGRTNAQARLTANGHPIAVAADGSFRQEMALSAPGSTKLIVRAQEANHAPRIMEIALERVTNLKQRADEMARSLPADFDAVSAIATEKPDTTVALRGEVVAIETVNASTRIAATAATCKRAPCLFSVRHGGPLPLRAGSHFLSIGKAHLVARAANTSERDLTLDASLVIEEPGR